MFEVNPLLFIMLVEGFIILLLALVLIIVFRFRSKARHRKAVKQLVSQVNHQSEVRMKETGSFLKDIYELEDSELKQAVMEIDKREKKFIQKIIDMFLKGETALLTAMDAAVAELIEPYKKLRPRVAHQSESEAQLSMQTQLETMSAENENLRQELDITKDKLQNMIGEFGDMFRGGSDHGLAKHEVVDKLGGDEK
jgi:hypothetical protein